MTPNVAMYIRYYNVFVVYGEKMPQTDNCSQFRISRQT